MTVEKRVLKLSYPTSTIADCSSFYDTEETFDDFRATQIIIKASRSDLSWTEIGRKNCVGKATFGKNGEVVLTVEGKTFKMDICQFEMIYMLAALANSRERHKSVISIVSEVLL